MNALGLIVASQDPSGSESAMAIISAGQMTLESLSSLSGGVIFTSPGPSGDPAEGAARGWHGAGPSSVVTDLGTSGFHAGTGEMTLRTLHPGVSIDDVRANMGWEPKIASELGETPPPTDEELRLIRAELDPRGVYTK